jgi:hypothetical protein
LKYDDFDRLFKVERIEEDIFKEQWEKLNPDRADMQ